MRSVIYLSYTSLALLLTLQNFVPAHCFPPRRLTHTLCPVVCSPLQRQVAGEVQTQPQDRAVNQIAMMLAIMGLSLSYYSAKQMTEKVQTQPAP